jgi:hypothetical protein
MAEKLEEKKSDSMGSKMKTAETVVWYHDDSDGGARRTKDNWYSKSLI